MTNTQHCYQEIQATDIVRMLLHEFGTLTEHRVLQDSLPRRLAVLLKCRSVLLYQRVGETLQLVAGSFDDKPGWSAQLLAIAHINPISLGNEGAEARAWRERQPIGEPEGEYPTLIALPLMYRHRCIGVLVAVRGKDDPRTYHAATWAMAEVQVLDVIADIVALLLENTRLLERDRERIHELSLLNSISSQMNSSLYEHERLKSIVVQRTKEISLAEMCAFIDPTEQASSWVTPALCTLLLQRFHEQAAPLMLERPGDRNDPHSADYLQQLPAEVKTFFAFPLLSGHEPDGHDNKSSYAQTRIGVIQNSMPKVLGIIVGTYHHIVKLKREEVVLLQVLTGQASIVLKNMYLLTEVVKARNEAHTLLRQVLADQRMKELILANIPSGLITTDRNGYIVTFNQAAETILGYHLHEVLGQPLDKFLQAGFTGFPHDGELCLERATQAGPRSNTVMLSDQQGKEVILDVGVLPLWGEPGEQVGLLVTFVDVTSIHHLAEEKRRLDRLASLGEMSANVAHEVRNPLASIKTAMQILASELAGSAWREPSTSSAIQEGACESIGVVLQEVERLDTIVRELLQFAKPRRLERSRCNIVELSDHVLQLLQGQWREANVSVQRAYSTIPPLWVDIAQIEQVLLNLYMNALQAMPDGGTLTIACRLIAAAQALREARTISPPYSIAPMAMRTNVTEGEPQWLELAVSDTGGGISPEQAERIFQPFVTTKAHGIGLGLAITRRLVEDHGGYIHVGGHFGYGATISVRLPLICEEVYDDERDGVEE